jgi:hypothetical protein
MFQEATDRFVGSLTNEKQRRLAGSTSRAAVLTRSRRRRTTSPTQCSSGRYGFEPPSSRV